MASMANRLLDQLLWWLRFEYIRGIDDHSTSEYIRLFKQVRTIRDRAFIPVVCSVRALFMASQTLDLRISTLPVYWLQGPQTSRCIPNFVRVVSRA